MLSVERFGPITRFRMARRVPGLRPIWVHAFWVDGLLIDAGLPHTAGELRDALAGLPVEQVVLTHHHEDHVGAAALLARERGLAPRIHPAGLAPLARPPRLQVYEHLLWGRPQPVAAAALGEAVETARYGFRVLHTPGHAPDHVVLYEPAAGWLFTGDLLIHPRVPTLRRSEHLETWIQSLRRAADLPAMQVFCSHYPKVTAPAALREKLDYWAGLAAQAAELQQRGLPLPAIRTRLLGPEGFVRFLTVGDISKLNLVQALLTAGPPAEG